MNETVCNTSLKDQGNKDRKLNVSRGYERVLNKRVL